MVGNSILGVKFERTLQIGKHESSKIHISRISAHVNELMALKKSVSRGPLFF